MPVLFCRSSFLIFFAVDTFLNFFLFASFYFSFAHYINKKKSFIVIAALFFGLALSCKISAIFAAPLIIFFVMNIKREKIKETISTSLVNLFVFGVVAGVVLKLTDPYLFATGSVIDIRPNPLFLNNISQLQALGSKNSFFPPTVQWISKLPLIFPLKNLLIWGFGIPALLLSILGSVEILKTKHLKIFGATILWIVIFVIYQGVQTTPTMRYFLIAYPYLAIFAGFGMLYIFTKQKIVFYILVVLILLYPLAFISIYTKPHTRVQASYWIKENISQGSTILSEHWDDALPVGPVSSAGFNRIELPVFDPDTPEKWETINNLLKQGDYLILSSNRGWGSIPTVPQRYPQMIKFYRDLLNNKTEYELVKEFTSYPSLNYLGIPITINDDSSEEAFTVYDHPKVLIFKKVK